LTTEDRDCRLRHRGQELGHDLRQQGASGKLQRVSENKSDNILIESFNSLDWLHTLKTAFNYILINSINYVSLDQQVSPPKHPSLFK
jgi:hypothetical protein